jgi:NAD(P)-dependent dehydrogenase (short-subunit alcohol dehydrogenase family)
MRFLGKKAVVTGGTHGMGLAVVRALLDGGAEVLLTGRDEKNLAGARAELSGKVHVVGSDAADISEVAKLGETVRQTLGEVDLVFVNVGFSSLLPLPDVTAEGYDHTFAVNTRGAYFTAQHLAPLVRRGGSFVFTTSVATGSGFPGMSVYAGAKAAVRAFARGFAAELAPSGVRVNVVSPGFIDTPSMGVTGLPAEVMQAFKEQGDVVTPLKRHGTVEEVAAAVLFLAFEATFTTGSELAVDGGLGERLTV